MSRRSFIVGCLNRDATPENIETVSVQRLKNSVIAQVQLTGQVQLTVGWLNQQANMLIELKITIVKGQISSSRCS